ncbi:molybdopterin converting factor subunit 1 [Chitinophaga sp. sic0106]|uniref:molybdopterin converting factor subunit 1 n=1 Tax=Chitinophaga sp. sic0106 TaxID=2854785 RepID=UPI001C46BCFA|nr:molybdopterin converting factor subunit 1 [Chitinophaga sp. sic0106]MBV7531680.1 molybdopterin converting factor subunit 1 [Chitinophaga sp. sic0106]
MNVMLFGVAKDIAGVARMQLPEGIATVGALKAWLTTTYPAMQQLNSLMIAVNKAYAADTQAVGITDEIAIIPPVSGG